MELPTHALCDTPIRYITHEGASWFSLKDTVETAQDLSERTRRQRIELRSYRAHIDISALRVLTSHAGVLRRTAKTLQEHAVARHGLIHVDTALGVVDDKKRPLSKRYQLFCTMDVLREHVLSEGGHLLYTVNVRLCVRMHAYILRRSHLGACKAGLPIDLHPKLLQVWRESIDWQISAPASLCACVRERWCACVLLLACVGLCAIMPCC